MQQSVWFWSYSLVLTSWTILALPYAYEFPPNYNCAEMLSG